MIHGAIHGWLMTVCARAPFPAAVTARRADPHLPLRQLARALYHLEPPLQELLTSTRGGHEFWRGDNRTPEQWQQHGCVDQLLAVGHLDETGVPLLP
jgi:hypothetical protein